MTSLFKKKLASGRTLEEILETPVHHNTVLGRYEISGSFKFHTFVLFFVPKGDNSHSILIGDDYKSFKEAAEAQANDYLERLKAAVRSKM